MALSKVNFNSMNVTPSASKAIKFNSSNNGLETGDIGGNLILISEHTFSSDASITITSGIDSTYKEYIFKFINIRSTDDSRDFGFQVDTGTNTNYNQSITSTFFDAYQQTLTGSGTELRYLGGTRDQANGTAHQPLTVLSSGENDKTDGSGTTVAATSQCECGTLHLFDPSNTTFVKHFFSMASGMIGGNYGGVQFSAGYINTTSAITRIKFYLSNSANITSGTIKMYGVL